jgi:ABC-type multidrug transport system permease subunit
MKVCQLEAYLLPILSAKLKTSEGFDTIVNGIFLIYSFASSAFYPTQDVPEALWFLFYMNPLTYVVDISRAGFFSQFNGITNKEVVLLTLFSTVAMLIAIRSIIRMSDSQVSTQVWKEKGKCWLTTLECRLGLRLIEYYLNPIM